MSTILVNIPEEKKVLDKFNELGLMEFKENIGWDPVGQFVWIKVIVLFLQSSLNPTIH